MKERQRWQAEEDALLCAYVWQFGPREWHLVSQRMSKPLNRNPKACLKRWKNYLRPGIKKGYVTKEEQRLVIHLPAKHGNKWKIIIAEVPGRAAERLGKWWEVFREKQQREEKDITKDLDQQSVVDNKYSHILEASAEKLVKQHNKQGYLMATSKGQLVNQDQSARSPPTGLPPWLSSSSASTMPVILRPPPSPSVTLTLSPSLAQSSPGVAWLQPDRSIDNIPLPASNGLLPQAVLLPPPGEQASFFELVECCKELEENRCALMAHKKDAAWRLRRIELQLESEKACKRMEKMEETEAKVKALREEQKATLDRIEAEYREQLAGFRRDAEAKEQKLAEQWAAKHSRLTMFLEQLGSQQKYTDPNGNNM